ncbi:MAG: SBBP repeat-containing protein [Verrucomicrobia bacterium]|nr:SBBP repeat-containing protein [Verrucomicrobiota bacterium]
MNPKPVFLAFLLITPDSLCAQPEKGWSRLWGGTTNDYGLGVAVDRAGDIFVAGSSEGPIAGQDNAGVTQSCLTKLTPDGKRLWTRLWSGQAYNEAMDVAVDSLGNVYVTGYTAGPLEGEPTVGRYDFFLTKIASGSEGTMVWTRVWGSTEIDTAYGWRWMGRATYMPPDSRGASTGRPSWVIGGITTHF